MTQKRNMMIRGISAVILLATLLCGADVINGNFMNFKDNCLFYWSVTPDISVTPVKGGGMTVQVVKPGKSNASLSGIRQDVKVKNQTAMRLSVETNSDTENIGCLSVNLRKRGKTFKTLYSAYNKKGKDTLVLQFNTADADALSLLIRTKTGPAFAGKKISFANLKLTAVQNTVPQAAPVPQKKK